MKVLTVVGARPQFVKAAVVSRALARLDAAVEEIVHTGQHYDAGMSSVFFEQMEIPEPVVNLGIGGMSHGEMTGAMLAAIEREIIERRPDWLLVYGDTDSTLAGALAAAKLHVPVAHVEAGLRSFNRRMPEEINRVLTDRVADLLFCPTEHSKDLLAHEGIDAGVHVVGDVMVDAIHHYRPRAARPAIDGAFALATLHRAENVDDPERLARLIGALAEAPVPVILPLHPRTKARLEAASLALSGALQPVEPFGYFEMLGHLEHCEFVLTDSGGLQKEAFVFGKKCVTLRPETEWVELVELGANRLVDADVDAIRGAIEWARSPLSDLPAVYGRGDAGTRIVEILGRAS